MAADQACWLNVSFGLGSSPIRAIACKKSTKKINSKKKQKTLFAYIKI
jgi:hypothetical protein